MERTKESIIEEVKKVLEHETYIDKRDSDGRIGYEVYCDYREELSKDDLAAISESDCPMEAFHDVMSEWLINAEDYEYSELLSKLKKNIPDYDEYEEDITNWVQENVYWYMPEDHFNTNVNVVVALDTGDANFDFGLCNVLNYYGDSEDHTLDEISPIRWLAVQQGKMEELEKALNEDGLCQSTDFPDTEAGKNYSNFTNSVISELQNSCSHMNSLIFLVNIKLFDFIKLKELIASEKDLNESYHYDERKGKKTFTVTKKASCGLFDVWGGGGSCLDIELEKDVVIPTKAIWDIWIDFPKCGANGHGYGVDDVYGLTANAWRGEVKF